jgi:hypothetical protein
MQVRSTSRRRVRATRAMLTALLMVVAAQTVLATPAQARNHSTQTVTVNVIVRPYLSPHERAEIRRRAAIDMKPWYGVSCPTDAFTYSADISYFGNHPGQHPSWEEHLVSDCPGWEHWRDVAIAEKRLADANGETARQEAAKAEWDSIVAKRQAEHDAALAPYMPK